KQYGTSVSTLRALNNIKGSALKIGTPLRVPGTNARG
ncbi:LysM peptidoglycan-binding domain-containing protein, partial [Achromobacter spanius]